MFEDIERISEASDSGYCAGEISIDDLLKVADE